MSTPSVSLYEFMPYGAPELREVARKYMVRAVLVGCAVWIVAFLLSLGTSILLSHRPKETSVIVVPYRELAAPPPLTDQAPPPQVAVTTPVASLGNVFSQYKGNKDIVVVIKIDRDAKFNDMVKIIDELDLANMTRFSLATLAPNEKAEVQSL